MRSNYHHSASKWAEILSRLIGIEEQAYELDREINRETQVTIAWHAYARKHSLQGKQFRIEYNKFMQAHHVERLMIPASDL
jgi:hypothetical protein